MLDQGGMQHSGHAPDVSWIVLFEEVATSVPGAYITSRVRSAAGGGGAVPTYRLVRLYLNLPDTELAVSCIQRFDRAWSR